MGVEEVTEFKLPFGMGRLDVSNPGTALFTVVAMVGGFTAYHATSAIGSNLAMRVNSFAGQFLPGGNPATGDNGGVPGV
jgi:hypothetical protein